MLASRALSPTRRRRHTPLVGVRLFNGRDEQMMTALLPNPFLTNTQGVTESPVWANLDAWDRIRREFLDLGPDPLDRSGTGFGPPTE